MATTGSMSPGLDLRRLEERTARSIETRVLAGLGPQGPG